MKRIITGALAGAAVIALSVGLMPATASAAHVDHLRGVWAGVGTGFMSQDGVQVPAQARLVFKKAKGDDVRARFQWRACEGREKKCEKNDLSGKGWSDKDTVLFNVSGDMLYGVEDEAIWDGHLLPDGHIHLVGREMQGGAPVTTPLIYNFHFVKVS